MGGNLYMIDKKKLSLVILSLIFLTVFAASNINVHSEPIQLGKVNVGISLQTTEHAAKSENSIYLYKNTFSPKLRCISLNDNSSKIYDTPPLTDFLVADDWIYYINTDNYGPLFTLMNGSIYRISNDGMVNEKIIEGNLGLVAADNEWIYYTDGGLYKMSKDNLNKIKLSDNIGFNYTYIDNYLYYCNFEDESKLYRFNLDTKENTKVLDESVSYYINEGYIYYTNLRDEKIYRVNLEGHNREKIADYKLDSFIVKDNWIYGVVLDLKNGVKLYKVRTDGTGLSKISDNATFSNIFAHEDWIFYINAKDNRALYKVKMDGSENVKVTDSMGIETIRYSDDSIYFIDKCRDNYLYEIDTNSSNISPVSNDRMRYITIIDDWIFYTDTIHNNGLYKIKKDGTKKTKITDDNVVSGFTIYGDWIYYSNRSKRGRQYRIKTDGSKKEVIKAEPIFSLSLNKGWMYFIKGYSDRDGNIYKMKVDGSNEKKLSDDVVATMGIDDIRVIDDWIYYINKSDNRNLYRIKIDGSDRTRITDSYASVMIMTEDWIYYKKESDDSKTYKIRINGEDETKIADYKMVDIKIYNGWLYYKKSFDGKLYKMKTGETEETMISDDEINVFSIVDDWIYYSLINESNLYRIKIDGSSKELIE